MRPLLLYCLVASLLIVTPTQAQPSSPDAETQITAAVKAAPKPMRDAATVRGYESDGTLTTLREGSGLLICLADDPEEDGFHVACYHESLGPFMQRGRELRRQGVTAVDSVRRPQFPHGARCRRPSRPGAATLGPAA